MTAIIYPVYFCFQSPFFFSVSLFSVSKIMSVLKRWMNLEPVIQSEMSKREKRTELKVPICRAAMERQT